MFPRLTMLNTMTSIPGIVFENSKMTTMPLTGKSISITELNPLATLQYPAKANPHGISYIVMSTNKVAVSLVRVEKSEDGTVERTNITVSKSSFQAFSMVEPTPKAGVHTSYELLIENISGERVKVSTIVT